MPTELYAPCCSWENQDEGFIAKLLVAEGAKDIAVGAPVALLVEEADQVAAFKDYTHGSGVGGAAAGAEAAAEQPAEDAAAAAASAGGTVAPGGAHHSDRMGPAARTLLAESGISADLVTPTGPNGIITKGDVLAAMAAGVKAPSPGAAKAAKAAKAATPAAAAEQQQPKQQPVAAAPKAAAPKAPVPAAAKPPPPPAGAAYTDIPNSQIRKVIAQRLLESKQTTPHL